ncbi:MAG TPA: Hpt domain-containing protein, partial [Nannocystaceae bacterium]|nr:Hpt domain-containing protein [Nannocystaceae bacterium]
MKKIIDVLFLPPTITEFESRYLARMNRIGMAFFALHIPVLATIAWLNDTGAMLAALLATLVMAGPALARRAFTNPRAMSLAYGFTAMLMGGLLVHFGQGPMQIEMHFYFFALLAMLVLFGNPLAIVVAAATVALHHLALWLVLPSSVFNYDAEVWVVAVHAAFVVVESIAACFIARSFFDNVIGLEKIVQLRTAELAGRNHEMRQVLDSVQQGLLTLDRNGVIAAERSAAADEMLGAPRAGERFADALGRLDADAGAWFDVGWAEVRDGVMPLELTLAQLPTSLVLGARHLELDYVPIGAVEGELDRVLVVVSDVTATVEHARLEGLQRELGQLFHRYASDRRGVVEFLEEGGELVERVTATPAPELAALLRALHTIKGNAGIFGVGSVADTCHVLEGI